MYRIVECFTRRKKNKNLGEQCVNVSLLSSIFLSMTKKVHNDELIKLKKNQGEKHFNSRVFAGIVVGCAGAIRVKYSEK